MAMVSWCRHLVPIPPALPNTAAQGRGWASKKVRCGPATVLEARLPSHGLHCLLSSTRVRLTIECPIDPLSCSLSLAGLEVLASWFRGQAGRGARILHGEVPPNPLPALPGGGPHSPCPRRCGHPPRQASLPCLPASATWSPALALLRYSCALALGLLIAPPTSTSSGASSRLGGRQCSTSAPGRVCVQQCMEHNIHREGNRRMCTDAGGKKWQESRKRRHNEKY